MTLDSPRPLLRIPRPLWDVGAAMLVLLPTLAAFVEVRPGRTLLGWFAALIPAVLVLMRRRFPWAVLSGCVLCFAVAVHAFPAVPGAPVATGIALYTIVVASPRRLALWTAGGATVILVALALTGGAGAGRLLGPSVFQIIVTLGFATALGDAVRTHRAYIAEIVQRAQRAEETREAEASRRVAEDRLRIARDLHDALAHQISVISLNAGVATSALESRPEVTREALATIRGASRTVLAEIGELLSALRLADEQASRSPAVGLAALDGLLQTFEASGLHTTLRQDDELTLSPAVDVVAYRVIQEALTNALKHGAQSRAHVWISRRDGAVRVVVTNPVDPLRTRRSPGHGLLGVRERVDGVGGTVQSEDEGTTFRLEATMPLAPAPPVNPEGMPR